MEAAGLGQLQVQQSHFPIEDSRMIFDCWILLIEVCLVLCMRCMPFVASFRQIISLTQWKDEIVATGELVRDGLAAALDHATH